MLFAIPSMCAGIDNHILGIDGVGIIDHELPEGVHGFQAISWSELGF